ncbi:mariner Mos1 transposase [Trichonephila clavipes]|nr:mariner Mos1 transposase [Trichonephila clavipes]
MLQILTQGLDLLQQLKVAVLDKDLKSARLLYNALSCAQCYRWFEKFQNGDFDVRNEECGRPAKKFEDAELQALLDEDDGQTQEHLVEQLNVDQSTVSRRLKAMDKIIKVGR